MEGRSGRFDSPDGTRSSLPTAPIAARGTGAPLLERRLKVCICSGVGRATAGIKSVGLPSPRVLVIDVTAGETGMLAERCCMLRSGGAILGSWLIGRGECTVVGKVNEVCKAPGRGGRG